jgi:glucose/arabinose dehydrogenase
MTLQIRTTLAATALAIATPMLGTNAGATAPSSGEPPAVTLTALPPISGPVDLTWRDGDAALYVVTQGGTVEQVAGDTVTTVLDIGDLIAFGGEQGLLGLAFAPSGDVAYVNFTDTSGHTNIAEFAVDATGAFNRDSLRTILVVEQPYANHNGGDVAFGPDGMLYIGMGDGGAGGDPERRSQDLTTLLGKMLRIDPSQPSTGPSGDLQYTIPADNPFVGQEGARGEVWSVGVRNPWRIAFDAETGDLWIADVGQNAVEEIDVAPADGAGLNAGLGLNFGWSGYEGDDVFNADVVVEGHYPPIYTYPHDGRCSISGGVRARGEGSGALAGWYVFGDYCTGQVFALGVSGEGTEMAATGDAFEIATTDAITAVASGPTGELYVLGAAGVQRIDPA